MAGPPWQSEFLVAFTLTWLQLWGRYTFENLYRQGLFSAVTYRKQFSKEFDFKQFNHLLMNMPLFAFDPSFISKAGKYTHGVGYFWSGCAQAVKRGLELAYYAQLLTSQATQLCKLSNYIAVDAYFAKYSFVEALSASGLT